VRVAACSAATVGLDEAKMMSGAPAPPVPQRICDRARHRLRPSECRCASCGLRPSPIAASLAETMRFEPKIPGRLRPYSKGPRCAACVAAAAPTSLTATPPPHRRAAR
jgi:hypothetical protein